MEYNDPSDEMVEWEEMGNLSQVKLSDLHAQDSTFQSSL
jgi:hypothetical protein